MVIQSAEYHEISVLGGIESQPSPGVLFVFPHSGKRTDGSAERFLRQDISDAVIKASVDAEYDLGTDAVLDYMRNNSEEVADKLGCNYAIAQFDLGRSIADANRVSPEGIAPDRLYAGELVLDDPASSRQFIAENYVWPYQQDIADFINQNPNMVVVHVHSMDQFSGGNASIGVLGQGERPLAEVMTGAWIKPEDYEDVISNNSGDREPFQVDELPNELIESACKMLTDALIRHSKGTRNDTAVNEPYNFNIKTYPPTLVGLVTFAQHLYNNGKATFVSVEARKDTQETQEGRQAYADALVGIAGLLLKDNNSGQ